MVIGNPPYSNFGQLNRIPFILDLLKEYKRGLNERKINLDDDFIKFVRLSQYLVDASGAGAVGIITNSVFLDGVTHRRMRECLMTSFPRIRLVDLHGSAKKAESTPTGSRDQNVFDIQQGVSISILCRPPAALRSSGRSDMRADVWGLRDEKYHQLAAHDLPSTAWASLQPCEPHFFLTVEKSSEMRADYQRGWSTRAIFPVGNDGIQTKRDSLTVQFTECELEAAVRDLKTLTSAKLRSKYGLPEDGRDWSVDRAREDVESHRGVVAPLAYRPFDRRYTLYTGFSKGFVAYPREIISSHLVTGKTPALALNRFIKLEHVAHFFAISTLVDTHLLETANSCLNVSPLYLADTDNAQLNFDREKRPNLSPDFLGALASRFGLEHRDSKQLPHGLTPEDVLHFVYALLHSPAYRARYAEFLKIDFPRVPLPGSLALFRDLARLGGELVALHLMEFDTVGADGVRPVSKGACHAPLQPPTPSYPSITAYTGPKNPEVLRVGWSDDTVWLDAAATKKGQPATPGTIGFHGAPEAVWNFHIGGYQVCEKWLKDRKGRTLSTDDIAHYQKIVVALHETIRLMKEIDDVIEKHGGWPGAFQTGQAQPASPAPIPFLPRTVKPTPKERYVTCVPLVPLKAAAGAFGDPQHVEDGQFEWVEVKSSHRLRRGMFVAQVVGQSMEPAIPDGSYCLFASPVEGTRQGKTVLVQLRNATDPETGERYTVKRYESDKTEQSDLWRHATITLRPINPDFKPIVLNEANEGQLQVIAELVEVLKAES